MSGRLSVNEGPIDWVFPKSGWIVKVGATVKARAVASQSPGALPPRSSGEGAPELDRAEQRAGAGSDRHGQGAPERHTQDSRQKWSSAGSRGDAAKAGERNECSAGDAGIT